MPTRPSGPIRTCVGCRQAQGVATLLRVARTRDGKVVLDATAAGRGAWICRDEISEAPRQTCLLRAERSGGFARAFRASVEEGSVTALVDGRWTSLPDRGAEHARIEERAAHSAVPEKGLT